MVCGFVTRCAQADKELQATVKQVEAAAAAMKELELKDTKVGAAVQRVHQRDKHMHQAATDSLCLAKGEHALFVSSGVQMLGSPLSQQPGRSCKVRQDSSMAHLIGCWLCAADQQGSMTARPA